MLNSKIKATTWNTVFKPKGSDRRIYSNSEGTTKVSDGHWIVIIPTDAIPAAYQGFIPGECGTYYKESTQRTYTACDFDAVIPKSAVFETLTKTSLIFASKTKNSYEPDCEAIVFSKPSGDISAIDRSFVALFEGLFDMPTFTAGDGFTIRVEGRGELAGVVMPIKADPVTDEINLLANKQEA